MTPDDFADRLSAQFQTKCTEVDKENLIRWLDKRNLSGMKLEIFYTKLIENYSHQHRYFPDLPTIRRIHQEAGESSSHPDYIDTKRCVQATGKWTVKRIVEAVKKMRAGDCTKCGTTCNTQIAFVYTWEMLSTWYHHLRVDKEWEEKRAVAYCEEIKEDIIAGRSIRYIDDKMDIVMPEKKRLPGETKADWDARKNRKI